MIWTRQSVRKVKMAAVLLTTQLAQMSYRKVIRSSVVTLSGDVNLSERVLTLSPPPPPPPTPPETGLTLQQEEILFF